MAKTKSTTTTAAGSLRHRRALRPAIESITKGALMRLAHRAGIKRIEASAHEELRGIIAEFVERVLRRAVTIADGRERSTLSTRDVVSAFELIGRPIYGYGNRF